MLLRKIARPLLATWFIYDGVDAARHPAAHALTARGPADQVTSQIGREPLTDRQLKIAIRTHGALTVTAGVNLAFGRTPRLAALALAALSVPLAVAEQPFTSGSVARGERTERFVRRLGAIGAALLAGIDTEGKPGVAWRVGHSRNTREAVTTAKKAE
jgi:uncharacterized membrane protein YphA (DoxX/SURF4 family)